MSIDSFVEVFQIFAEVWVQQRRGVFAVILLGLLNEVVHSQAVVFLSDFVKQFLDQLHLCTQRRCNAHLVNLVMLH